MEVSGEIGMVVSGSDSIQLLDHKMNPGTLRNYLAIGDRGPVFAGLR